MKYPILNSIKNHKRNVYGMLSALLGISFLLTPTLANAAYLPMNNTSHIQETPFIYPNESGYDFLAAYKSANGVQLNQIPANLSVAILAQDIQHTNIDGVVCRAVQYNVYMGNYMRWVTTPTGQHKLQRTIGYEADGTTPLTGFTGDLTSGGHWPYVDDTGTSNDHKAYMNKTYVDPASVRSLHSSMTEAQCKTAFAAVSSELYGAKRYNGTAMSTMGWTDIINSHNNERPTYQFGGGFFAIASAENITYDSSYTGRKTNMGVGNIQNTINAMNADQACPDSILTPLETLTCKLSAFLGETLSSLWRGITWLFVPDGQQIEEWYTTEKEYWQSKFGFLGFPITALGTLFTELTDNSNFGGCTETLCNKDFGEMFGSNLTINFSAMHNVSPALWTFILTMLRIGAIWTMVITLRWQYWRLMHKGTM